MTLQEKLTEMGIKGPFPGIGGLAVFSGVADSQMDELCAFLREKHYRIFEKHFLSDGWYIGFC